MRIFAIESKTYIYVIRTQRVNREINEIFTNSQYLYLGIVMSNQPCE